MNLLIVDDERLEVDVIEKLVNKEETGIEEIYTAYSMNQAMEVIRTNQVDILLTDIEMPKGSGHRLVEWVRSEEWKIVPIFLTSHAVFDYAQQALTLRVNAYLLKPIETDELNHALKKAIEEHLKSYPREENDTIKKIPEIINQVQNYIQNHLNNELSRTELAAQVYLHPDYLSHMFKDKTGMSISDYIMKARMDHACELLRGTEKQVSEIAMESGYGSIAYFTQIFKRIKGMTPSEYRRRG